MKCISLCVLTVFLTLSLLVFTAMLSEDMQGSCIASLAQNGACPPDSSFELALFHTNALKVFSTTLISVVLLAGFLLLFLFYIGSTQTIFFRTRPATFSETVRSIASRSGAL